MADHRTKTNPAHPDANLQPRQEPASGAHGGPGCEHDPGFELDTSLPRPEVKARLGVEVQAGVQTRTGGSAPSRDMRHSARWSPGSLEDDPSSKSATSGFARSLSEAGMVSRRLALRLGLGAAAAALAAVAIDTGARTTHQGGSHLEAGVRGRARRRGATGEASSPASSAPGGASGVGARTALGTAPRGSTPPPGTELHATAPSTTPERAPSSLSPASPGTSPAPPEAVAPGAGPAPSSALRFFGPPEDHAVYLTVDDGWYPNTKVLDLMRADHVPLTTFLISRAADDDPEHLAYWKAFVDAGGVVQNHTVSHPWLTKVPAGDVEGQWAGASAAFTNWFGFRPTLGRPPYGAVNDAVWQAAANCGLEELVMWSAVDNGHGLQTWNQQSLQPGAIVLMHWDPGLYGELRQVLSTFAGLGVSRPTSDARVT